MKGGFDFISISDMEESRPIEGGFFYPEPPGKHQAALTHS